MMDKLRPSYRLFTSLLILALACISLGSLCGWLWTRCVNTAPINALYFIVAPFIIGVLTITWQAWRTIRCTRQLLQYSQIPLTSELEAQIIGLGLDPAWFILIQSSHPLTFCFGFLRPRICLSTGLNEILTRPQLRAALLHEEYHRKRFDPLRLLLAEAVSKALFLLPVVHEWLAVFKIQLELDADQYAIRKTGKAALAGTLHRLLSYEPLPVANAITAGLSANNARIAALLGERSAVHTHISRKSLLCSAAILMMLCFLL